MRFSFKQKPENPKLKVKHESLKTKKRANYAMLYWTYIVYSVYLLENWRNHTDWRNPKKYDIF